MMALILQMLQNMGQMRVVLENIGDDASKMELFTLHGNTPFG
jgi:hypothetical protein